MQTETRVIEKIRKLLNLAENDGAAEGEIKNAMAAAQRLMVEHQLSEDDVRIEQGPREMKQQKVWLDRKALSAWEGQLSHIAARVGGCGVYVDTPGIRRSEGTLFAVDGGRPKGGLMFYGEAEAVEVAATMFAELRLAIATMAVGRYGGCYKGPGRSYAEGFTYGLWDQVREPWGKQQTAEQTAIVRQSTAIVQQREDEARRWLAKEHGIRLRSRGSSSGGGQYFGDAHGEGRRDGRGYNMGGSRRGSKLNAGSGSRCLPA